MIEIPDRLIAHIREHGIVLMAGAGVSMGPPTCLPGWDDLNNRIVDALSHRIDSYLGRTGWTAQLRDALKLARTSGSIPPDYQAQILEELCGERYFHALRSLDVNVRNPAHNAIAALAKNGLLRAIVTTNFDRLIEQGLEAARIPYRALCEADGYLLAARALETGNSQGLLVLKVHGCVSKPSSLVDTLKQRLKGRNKDLNGCLAMLLKRYYWLIVGFSAIDLETDEGYMQFVPCAAESPGLTYLQHPLSAMKAGAKRLLDAYTGKSQSVEAGIGSFCQAVCERLGMAFSPPPESAQLLSVEQQVTASLSEWADMLTPAASITCLSALFEASGEPKGAFDLLHRFWKDVSPPDRQGPDFEEYRFQHGRLGVGGGLLSPLDLESDIGLESFQNLLRRQDDPRAGVWADLARLWGGRSDGASAVFGRAMHASTGAPAQAEIRVDICLALAESMYLFGESEWFFSEWARIAAAAEEAGDLPRQALVITMAGLYHAEFKPAAFNSFWNGIPSLTMRHSERLHDRRVEGFFYLGHGHHLARQHAPGAALGFLNQAIASLRQAGRTPWRIRAVIEYAKGLMDLKQLDDAAAELEKLVDAVERWPVWSVWFEEAWGQLYLLRGQKLEACNSFERAVSLAMEMKLSRRAEALSRYLDRFCRV
jgi:tetratricopeptide (TPR) repeat protein